MQSTCKVRNPPRAIHSLRYTAVAVLRPNTENLLCHIAANKGSNQHADARDKPP